MADSHARGGSLAVTVRPATDAECEVVAGLAGELGYPVGAESVCARLGRLPAGDAVLVAEAKPAVETGGHNSGEPRVSGTQRIEAHAFYQGLGYREAKTQRVFVKDLR